MILLWGSNAREAHPIFFHHMLKAIHAGAQMYAVDPRRTTSAQWADTWLGLNVGSDIALANAMAREIVHAGLHNREFIARATEGFEAYVATLEPYTLERGEELSGVPADVIKDVAHTYARAERAQICWTLGITEHHNAVDNVLALINLALLTGHVGRYGSGLNPLRGQNNVQGGGDMGAIPNRLPGFQDLETDPEAVAKFERVVGHQAQAALRVAHDRDVRGDGARRADDAVRARREPRPVRRGRASRQEAARRPRALRRPGHLPHRDRADGGRRPARVGQLGRGGGHGHEQRAARAALPQGARPARPGARRHADPGRPRGAARPRVALRVGRGDLGRAALAGAEPRRHELPAPGGARRHPVAVLPRGQARAVVPARPPVGAAPRGAAGDVPRRRGRSAGRQALEGVPAAPHHRPPAGLVQHRRADRRLHLAAAPARGARAVHAPTPRSSA